MQRQEKRIDDIDRIALNILSSSRVKNKKLAEEIARRWMKL